MTTTALAALLDQLLPDAQVIQDLQERLRIERSAENRSLSSGAEGWPPVPADAPSTVITKIFFHETLPDIGFGAYRALVALGTWQRAPYGIIKAEHGFATLYYSADRQLITYDRHDEFR